MGVDRQRLVMHLLDLLDIGGRRVRWSHRARRPLIVVAVSLALSAGAGCDASEESVRETATETTNGSADPTDMCADFPAREACNQIAVGDQLVRYALLRPSKPTSDTVVVDLGGPGVAILSGSHQLAQFRNDTGHLGERYNLLFVEEPWVTQEMTDACSTAASAHYRKLSSGAPGNEGASLQTPCGLWQTSGKWGLNGATYRHAVQAISTEKSLRIRGFLGHSFGAARLSYLAESPLDWVILVRPFPVGATADEISIARARELGRLAKGLRGMRADHSPQPLRRAVPVTEFDKASAIVGLGYLIGDELRRLGPGVVSGVDLAEIGRLSDRLWFRYGEDSVSGALLAQMDEICQIVEGPRSAAVPPTSVDGVIDAMFEPCRGRSPVEPTFPRAAKVCVVTGAGDTVAPADLAVRYIGAHYPTARFLTSREPSHSSSDGLSRCYEAIKP